MGGVSTTLCSYFERAVTSSTILSDRYYGVFLPWCSEVATRLELPAWDSYRDAWAVCTRDILKASSSAYHLSYLTLKPIAILLWIVLGQLWKFVLEHGGRSLHTGAVHLKLACVHFYRFQMSLNGTQLLGEAGVLLMCVGLYYFRKWLQKQTYWAKFVKWYKAKKRRLIQRYTDTVHKIAKVSKILAMALPHLVFFGVGVGLKIVVPGGIRYVTYETPTTAVLSLYYPFISTLVWVHTQRHDWGSNDDNKVEERNNNSSEAVNGVSKQKSDMAERKKKFETETEYGDKKKDSVGFMSETVALETTRYWLNYWQLYAVIQAVGSCLSMIPIVGRFLVSHPLVGFFTGEFKLFFFVWVFGMERLLGKTSKDDFLAEALPLRLIQNFIRPLILQLHSLVSDAISKEFWQKWVVSKTKTTLDIAVMVRAISEQRRDWLVHIVEEARVLTLPSITLLMPGFVTQFGVAYVQYMVPSAKSAEVSSKAMKVVYLQYWILHCGTAGLLHKLGGVLWWVPFSTHMIFLLWSYLILPQAIKSLYGILESELLAFGILPKGKNESVEKDGDSISVVKISDTKTAWLFQSLVDRLPSAVGETNETDQKDVVANQSTSSLQNTNEEPSEMLETNTESIIPKETKRKIIQASDDNQPPRLRMEASTDKTPVNAQDIDKDLDHE